MIIQYSNNSTTVQYLSLFFRSHFLLFACLVMDSNLLVEGSWSYRDLGTFLGGYLGIACHGCFHVAGPYILSPSLERPYDRRRSNSTLASVVYIYGDTF